MKSRGYFGLALYQPKTSHNWGSLIRTANILGCNFIATIGPRFRPQVSDTLKSHRHIPVLEFTSFDEFKKHCTPYGCKLIGVELEVGAQELKDFKHPERAVYILGSEDNGLPAAVLSHCSSVVKLQGERSMNVAVAGSIVLYHSECL